MLSVQAPVADATLLGTADRGPGASDHDPGDGHQPSAIDEQGCGDGASGAGGQHPSVSGPAASKDGGPFGDRGRGGVRGNDQEHSTTSRGGSGNDQETSASRGGPGANDQEPQTSHGPARSRPCALSVPLAAWRGEQEAAPVPLLPPPAKITGDRAASAPPPVTRL